MGIGDFLKKAVDYGTPIGWGGMLYSKATGNANPVDSLINSATGAVSPSQASTQPLQQAQANSLGLQNQFGGLASAFQGAYNPAAANQIYQQQQGNIGQLTAQANGTAPSAAELMLRQQGATNAAQAYGTAAAIGGRTPGMAMDAAMRASQQMQATTNQQAATQRAADQAQAQSALAQALSGMQGQQQTLRGQDLNQLQSLYGNQLAAGGQIANAAGAQVNANATNAATKNQFYGGLIGGAGTALALSDRREKTNIKPATGGAFDKLADAIKGYEFEYKDPSVPGAAPGPRAGFMAQDAKRGGPLGRALVQDGEDGRLRVDLGNVASTALAMSAEALRRTRAGRGKSRLAEAFQKAA